MRGAFSVALATVAVIGVLQAVLVAVTEEVTSRSVPR